ncbi:cyclohexanone monooxygenase [Trichoderma arundinaceum]|uniref:Cyclohexanone monooxygenase n=1 Tax=Trichoderma arundinaceum TaxID=490622 RepID=A0A395NQN4_TRIAR|nr:cyclohexanone monooxygenase [Trichoderma arundinaceum]
MQSIDAIVVGAGFGGIYQLYKLRELGLSVRLIDKASDVGGTWYWNRYPGANSDSLSEVYRYSWDKEDLLTYPWPNHYVSQKEILAYLNHVVKRHDLKRYMQFNTELESASFDNTSSLWTLQFSTGEVFRARYLITALGTYSKINYPTIAGLEKFNGQKYHTGNWPKNYDLKGKRVGVIGNGSTGVQVMIAIADEVKQLVSFQRSPQYVVPNGDGPVSTEFRDRVNKNYEEIWNGVLNSYAAHNVKESTTPAMSVSAEERERIFESLWKEGNGFRFMFSSFSDILTSEEANEEACNFIRKKISQIVEDPEKVRKLSPRGFYARRPVTAPEYYEIFNKKQVDVVNLGETPIVEITEKGIRTNEKLHELDVIIFATGFEVADGNYTNVAIKGRHQTLKEHWAEGTTSYLGVSEAGFPNMFMVVGPQSPFNNFPPTIETQVNFIMKLISKAEKKRKENSAGNGNEVILIEATQEAENDYMEACRVLGSKSLFRKEKSYVFGANIPGKKTSVLFWLGGLVHYRKALQDVVDNDYRGFTFST